MKFLYYIGGLALLSFLNASAQISVTVTTDQDQFLPSETLPVTVHVTNRSGQTVHLGADAKWLTFDVESTDGFVVLKNADPPVLGEFDLGSSEVATKQVNIQPYFALTRASHYTVIATVRIKEWGKEISSAPKGFDIIDGARLWSQTFGLPTNATNQPPEVRKYTLEEANYLRSQLRLYAQVSDESESHVFKVCPLCHMVSFSQPEAQIDRVGNLHVLCQSGGAVFTYSAINPNGDILKQEIYDYQKTHPRLDMDSDGNVIVVGGVRRVRAAELPVIKPPSQAP